ncbi:3D domain-containing protein [Oceanobacillus sp. FSL H7-0719]|uniref:3D domain-containing protein n=1 Tax=Oceanobacillus sp. FSL H7-0719 TaxID=2954507 RepID=UPI00324955FF
MVALVCFAIARGDGEEKLSSPLLNELVEMNKNEIFKSNYPSVENYYAVRDKLDKLIADKIRKEGLAKSEKVKEEKRRLAAKRKAEEKKLVQLAKVEEKRNWQTFEITQYTSGYESTQKRKGEAGYGITASGEYVQEGLTIACSPDIPFGTKIYIEILDHTYTCFDRGSLITSGKIDVYVNDLSKAIRFGRQKSRGYIVKE